MKRGVDDMNDVPPSDGTANVAADNAANALKEQHFREQVAKLKQELDDIRAGTHPGLLAQINELDQARTTRMKQADMWRQYQTNNVLAEYKTEKKVADDVFKEEKKQQRDRMVNDVTERRKMMADDKGPGVDTTGNKKLWRRKGISIDKELLGTPPRSVSYKVTPAEAAEDLAMILRGTGKDIVSSALLIPDNSSAVFAEDSTIARGTLTAGKLELKKGALVSITCKEGGAQFHGTIVVLNPVEMQLVCADGSRGRFPIAGIKTGDFVVQMEKNNEQ